MSKLVKLKNFYFRKKDIRFAQFEEPSNCGEPYSVIATLKKGQQLPAVELTESELAQFEEQLTKYL